MASQVFKLKDREGYLLRFTLTKAIRKGPPCSFLLIPSCASEVCRVNWISSYLSVCDLLNVRLAPGFFFRASDRNKHVDSRPFVGSTASNRLRGDLIEAKSFDDETTIVSGWLRLIICECWVESGEMDGRWLNISPECLTRLHLSRSDRYIDR